MAEWLLAITVGPVGRFIAGGRRSRDLWWGSSWVSECSVEVALGLRSASESGHTVECVVPSKDRLDDIVDRYRSRGRAFGGRISNRLLARVRGEGVGGKDIAELASACEKRARFYLASQLRRAHQQLASWGPLVNDLGRVWIPGDFEDQVATIENPEDGDFLEFYAAWTPIRDSGLDSKSFKKAYERGGSLLAARKSARLFEAPSWTSPGRPKCDLDAGRDSVLRNARDIERSYGAERAADHRLARQRLGIRRDENLDALGLARRLAAFEPGPKLRRLPFPPLGRVAIDPWLRRAEADPGTRAALEHVRDRLEAKSTGARYDEVQERFFFAWSSPARDPEDPVGETLKGTGLFRFDAAVLLEGGIDALKREVERVGEQLIKILGDKRGREWWTERKLDDTVHLLDRELRPSVERLHAIHGVPQPYYALLAMDGDGVGSALSEAPDVKTLEARVKALDAFADEAEALVCGQFGCAFYVGGDDLMAYLPLDQAPAAARELAAAFDRATREAFTGEAAVTLSGGLAVAHVKADLRAARHQAHDALESAKRRRRRAGRKVSWLEIRELPRGGARRVCQGPLDELVTRLEHWRRLYAGGRLSPRSAQFLMELRERLEERESSRGPDGAGDVVHPGIELAAWRLRAQAERAGREPDTVLAGRLEDLRCWKDVAHLAAELKVALRYQRIAALRPTAGEEAES